MKYATFSQSREGEIRYLDSMTVSEVTTMVQEHKDNIRFIDEIRYSSVFDDNRVSQFYHPVKRAVVWNDDITVNLLMYTLH